MKNKQQNKLKSFSRRQFLQCLQVSLFNSVLFSGVSVAEDNRAVDMDGLITALQATEKAGCVAAAERLERQRGGDASGGFDLHLRSAGLTLRDAELIAQALLGFSGGNPANHFTLRSFSLSYNPGLTDAGVLTLTAALPNSLTELGLVGCDLGDESGLALLRWCRQAAALRMICVEDNRFSAPVRESLLALRRDKVGLMVVV